MAGWKNKEQVNIRGLAIKEGFKEEFIIENFWKEDSIKFNFGCTTLGKPLLMFSNNLYERVRMKI